MADAMRSGDASLYSEIEAQGLRKRVAKLEEDLRASAADHRAWCGTADRRISEFEAEVERLRQGLWDCAVHAGIDTDGDTTYHGSRPDIVDFAVGAVQELMDGYNVALSEIRLVAKGKENG